MECLRHSTQQKARARRGERRAITSSEAAQAEAPAPLSNEFCYLVEQVADTCSTLLTAKLPSVPLLPMSRTV